jgi:hypothetical protein
LYTLDPVIVESRLSIVKAFKEADLSLEFRDVLDQNRPDLHSLGALVQNHINKLYTQYLSIGITFEEFYEDLIESLLRSGFVHDRMCDVLIETQKGFVQNIFCGIDQEYPYSQVLLSFSLTRE